MSASLVETPKGRSSVTAAEAHERSLSVPPTMLKMQASGTPELVRRGGLRSLSASSSGSLDLR